MAIFLNAKFPPDDTIKHFYPYFIVSQICAEYFQILIISFVLYWYNSVPVFSPKIDACTTTVKCE